MSLRRRALVVAVGLIAGGVIIHPGAAYAAKEIQNVFVTNTDDQPVPVTGTVKISKTAPAEVFYRQATLEIGHNSLNTCSNCDRADLLNVPDGKVAVIEHVSMRMESTAELIPSISIFTEGGLHYVKPDFLGTEASLVHPDHQQSRVYMASHPLRLVVPASTHEFFGQREVRADLFVELLINSPNPYHAKALVRITGYLIDGNTAVTSSDAAPAP